MIKQSTLVDSWNANNQAGVIVYVRRDNGELLRTVTRSSAQMMGDVGVIWVKGIAGCYRLDRVRRARSRR